MHLIFFKCQYETSTDVSDAFQQLLKFTTYRWLEKGPVEKGRTKAIEN